MAVDAPFTRVFMSAVVTLPAAPSGVLDTIGTSFTPATRSRRVGPQPWVRSTCGRRQGRTPEGRWHWHRRAGCGAHSADCRGYGRRRRNRRSSPPATRACARCGLNGLLKPTAERRDHRAVHDEGRIDARSCPCRRCCAAAPARACRNRCSEQAREGSLPHRREQAAHALHQRSADLDRSPFRRRREPRGCTVPACGVSDGAPEMVAASARTSASCFPRPRQTSWPARTVPMMGRGQSMARR